MSNLTLTEKRRLALAQGGLAAEALRTVQPADATEDAILVELLAIREQVRRGRRYGYTLSLQVLRNKAMCLAEAFVDPDFALEQREQVSAEQARIPADLPF